MSSNTAKQQVKRAPRTVPWYVKAARFLVRRASNAAIAAIIVGAGVAVFAGSLSSARAFGFPTWAAWAFAMMPDALMVYSAAKQHGRVTPTQYEVAKRWMRVALGFSVFTNMNAAALALRIPSSGDPRGVYVAVMTVVYHGVVVVFLWGATEVATRKHANRQPSVRKPMRDKGSGQVAPARLPRDGKGRKASTPPVAPVVPVPEPLTSTNSALINGVTRSGLHVASR